MRSKLGALVVAVCLIGSGIGVASAQSPGVLRAGAAVADISWHIGAGQGQYGTAGNTATSNKFDPYAHGTKETPTDGMQARMHARAVVVEGADGTRVAYLSHDLYLQQDILHRRVAQLVSEAGVGIDREHLMIGASHNHSAPYFATTSWGVWVFTDTFDYRQFDYLAHQMAKAVIDASNDLRPATVGASVSKFSEVQRNILGPGVADDGTPAGFPRDYFDDDLTVIRFDEVDGAPIGAIVNLGMHPESIETVDMTTPDFVGMVEANVSRRIGAPVAWSQGAVGDVEPDQDAQAHKAELKREFWHRNFAQAERMSDLISDAVVRTFNDVADGTPNVASKYVAPTSVAPVQMIDRTFGGPASHPVPTVSNCRTDRTARGQVSVPVAGLPDCESAPGPDLSPLYNPLQDAQAPLPSNYGAPSHDAVQETYGLHLQVLRIGQILLASCPCEPVSDMVRNFKTRADTASGQHVGFDWPCEVKDANTYRCDYRTAAHKPADWRDVSKAAYDHMRAQIHNDAAGWDTDSPDAIATAEHEPTDPALIKGNFTHQVIQDIACGQQACAGFTLPVMVGQANDYNGYVVTYREYQRGDHYRKALTAYGPHTADYINSRLVRLAAQLQGANRPGDELTDAKVAADGAFLDARLAALGAGAQNARKVYESALPDDGGTPAITSQPQDSKRFSAARLEWVGGSNYTDNPTVAVEKFDGSTWKAVADQNGGEVVVNYRYTSTSDPQSLTNFATGQSVGRYIALFEVFDRTAPGLYRFTVSGHHRSARAPQPYSLASQAFRVKVWDGLRVASGSVANGNATFTTSPVSYPRTYAAPGVPYIKDAIKQTATGPLCTRCTFRPWASTGAIVSATVTVTPALGTSYEAAATLDPQTQVWTATGINPGPGDTVSIQPGGLTDEFGNTNAEAFNL